MRAQIFFMAAFLLGGGLAAGQKTMAIRQLADMDAPTAAAAEKVVLNGVVLFVSGIEPGRFVLANPESPRRAGVTVVAAPGIEMPQFGDCVQVEGVTFWAANFRRGGLQERRGEIIRERGFYNQTWCGCEFSQRD